MSRRQKSPSLDGPTAKVERADFHYSQVVETWNEIIGDPDSYSYSVAIADDGLTHTYSAVKYPTVDPEWGLILGDCVHNLRSALDHLAWELIGANGGTAKSGPNGTQFPITTHTPVKITAQAGEVHPAALKLIDEAQPRHAGDDGENLTRINLLDIMDKHHHLIVTAMSPDFYVTTPDWLPGIIARGRADPAVSVKAGDVVAWFTYAAPVPDRDPNLDIAPGISFEEGPLAGESFMELGGLVRWTREFLARFTGFF